MGVSLYGFFFQVAHKGMARLGGQQVSQEVSIEEDALQEQKSLNTERGRERGRRRGRGRGRKRKLQLELAVTNTTAL